jgi:hypothetical protein
MLSDEVPLSQETLCYNGTELDVPKITVLSAIRYDDCEGRLHISFLEIFKQGEKLQVLCEIWLSSDLGPVSNY